MRRDYIRPSMLLFHVETKGRLLTVSEKQMPFVPTDGTNEALSRENRWGGSGMMRNSRSVWDEKGE